MEHKGRLEIVPFLLSHGADKDMLDSVSSFPTSPSRISHESQSLKYSRNVYSYACLYANTEMLKFPDSIGVDRNQKIKVILFQSNDYR